jgi:hypothetical protein
MGIVVIGSVCLNLVAACRLTSSGDLATCVRTDEVRSNLSNRGMSSTLSTDEFRIDPFDNGIPYDWARPSHKEAEFMEFTESLGFMELE